MPTRVSRRALLRAAAAAPLAGFAARPAIAAGQADASAPKKSVLVTMLPKDLPWQERFALAKEVGFEGIEMQTVEDRAEAEAIAAASQAAGLPIHSVMNMAHWRFPLSSGDPEVVQKSVAGMKTSLMNAALWKANAVLLVPAVVDAQTSYADAWKRSQAVIREQLLPVARGFKVIIAVEEVWNKFLLSPLEFARYVDEFQSPWVRAYFDVGNIVFYGYPQDWIRTLGKRIVRVHLKDFKLDRGAGRFEWTNIGEGDIDWIEVRRAFSEIGYTGYMTTEISGGDRQYLRDVATRVDRFLAGFKPVS